MKKVQYLRKQDDLVLDGLMYDMELVSYEAGTLLFEEKARASKVYFLIEGEPIHFRHDHIG